MLNCNDCFWYGSLDQSGRKNYFYTYCPACGSVIAIPPKVILQGSKWNIENSKTKPRWGDLVEFKQRGKILEGTFLQDKHLRRGYRAEIQSGNEVVWVPVQDVVGIIERKEKRPTNDPVGTEKRRDLKHYNEHDRSTNQHHAPNQSRPDVF